MAYPKKLNAANKTNQQKAIEAHAGFVAYVCGKVSKVGLEIVLQQYATAFEVTEYLWLKKAFERVLDFAEQIQIKSMPTQVNGPGENGEFKLTIEIKDENSPSPQPGNRISEYITL